MKEMGGSSRSEMTGGKRKKSTEIEVAARRKGSPLRRKEERGERKKIARGGEGIHGGGKESRRENPP